MTLALVFQVIAVAKATVAVSLILNIMTVLNGLLILVLFFVLTRNLVHIYLERKAKKPGFKLRSKLVLALLPLTLFPAVMMFLFASRLPEQILSGLSIDANIETLIENSQALSESYIQDLHRIHTAFGPAVSEAWLAGPDEVLEFMNKQGIQGVEIVEDGSSEFILAANFPKNRRGRVDDLSGLSGSDPVEDAFDDGLTIWRFPYAADSTRIHFIYAKETGYTEKLSFIAESYAALDLLKRKRQTVSGLYQSTLLIITLSVIFGGIWMGLRFARTFLGAFGKLTEAAEQVGHGDFETFVDLKTGDEMDDVVHAFNSMTQTLKMNQEELKTRADDLKLVNDRLSTQMEYTQTLLREVNTGIISTNDIGDVRTLNPAAAEFLGVDLASSLNRPITDVLCSERHQGLVSYWQHYLTHAGTSSVQLEIPGPSGDLFSANITFVPLSEAQNVFGHMVVLEDLTSLINAQKLAAWREVARRVAHEIKNPLTPIQLSTQRIARKAAQNADDLPEAVQSAHETIMAEISILKNLVNDFSTYARLPSPTNEHFDLRAMMENLAESYAPMYPDLHFKSDLPKQDKSFYGDPAQIRQVVTNLIHNAAQASPKSGTIWLKMTQEDVKVILSVEDQGPGIPSGERDQIFIPYYSKSPKGTGLGLAIVKRIIEDHEGTIKVSDGPTGGAIFTLELPCRS